MNLLDLARADANALTKPKLTNVVIVAPHSDDEWLGCSVLLLTGKVAGVFYPLRMHSTRKSEALSLAADFSHQVWFEDAPSSLVREGLTVLLPSPRDNHPDHQQALTRGLEVFGSMAGVTLGEYAVAGRAPYCTELPSALSRSKRELFAHYFPSQQTVGLDDRFFLLEGYSLLLGGSSITVNVQKVGFHCWPNAPLSEEYLRYRHRHVFGCRVTFRDLYEKDRELEYHAVQKVVDALFAQVVDDTTEPDHSCEAMARRVAINVRAIYRKPVSVRVDEDGECWSEVSL